MERFEPRDQNDVIELVTAAVANEQPMEVMGTRTRAGLGRPLEFAHGLSTTGLTGVSLYEPSELVLTAGAGTPMQQIVDLLDQNGQALAFEPMDFGPLFGAERGEGTIGGTIAVNAAGPRRIKSGAARDHLLGFHAVSGRAEAFQSGGRVMKNVTGYDLSKLMTGSYGTLAVLTDVTVKVLPKPETEETLLLIGLDDDEAISAMTEASGLPHEVSSFSHIPASSTGGLTGEGIPTGKSITALRLEGPEISVAKRKQDLIDHFGDPVIGKESLTPEQSASFWADIRDVVPLAGLDSQIWRLSTAPTEGARLLAGIRERGVPIAGSYYDWAGGLIWLAVEAAAHGHAEAIRGAVSETGGHATLIRAANDVRATVPVFHPQPAALAALSNRVKDGFDPSKILNPGRLVEVS